MAQELEQALEDFKKCLTPEERTKLLKDAPEPRANAVLQFTAELDAENSAKKGGRCISSRICTFLDSVQQFTTVVDSFISASPEIAKLVWSSVKLTFLVVSNVTGYFDKLSKFIMEMRNDCPRFNLYQDLFPHSQRLQASLCRYYATVINLCTHIMQIKHVTTALWKPFDSEFGTFQKNLEQQCVDVRRETTLASEQARKREMQLQKVERQQSRQERDAMARFRRREELSQQQDRKRKREIARARKQKLLDDLSDHSYESALKRGRKCRLKGTCVWLTESPEFKTWKTEAGLPVLWCSGPCKYMFLYGPTYSAATCIAKALTCGEVGCGKTIHCTNVIDTLLCDPDTKNAVIAFFFCEYSTASSLTARTILSCLAKQILTVDSLSENLEVHLNKILSKDSADLSELGGLMEKLTEGRLCFLILDGLDECPKEERSVLMTTLGDMQSKVGNCKIFISSRPDIRGEVMKNFKSHQQIHVQSRNTDLDIGSYIEAALAEKITSEELIIGDSDIVSEIRTALLHEAKGMFLWVTLQFENICLQTSDYDIRRALRSLPRDLPETYQRAVNRINRSPHAIFINKEFRWLAAAQRPMTVLEVREALSIEPGQTTRHLDRSINDERLLQSEAAGLVIIDEEDSAIRFVHQTLKSFLTETRPTASDAATDHFFFQIRDASHMVGVACVTYLHFSDFQRQVGKVNKLTNLNPTDVIDASLNTALGYKKWSLGQRLAGKLRSRAVEDREIIQTLVETASPQEHKDPYMGFPFLEYAAEHWLIHCADFHQEHHTTWRLFQQLLKDKNPLAQVPFRNLPPFSDEQPSFSEAGLSWIMRNKHNALMSLMVQHHPKDAYISVLMEFIQVGVTHGDRNMIEFLNERDRKHVQEILEELLIEAVEKSSIVKVQTLLAVGTDAAASKDGIPALGYAVEVGNVEISQALLAAGADVEALIPSRFWEARWRTTDEDDHWDYLWGRPDRDSHAEAAASSSKVLQAAISLGNLALAEMLLEAGADSNFMRGTRLSCVYLAAGFGHHHVLELFLAASTTFDASSVDALNALYIAFYANHVECVRMLLASGVDVNHQFPRGETVLHLVATRSRSVQLMKLLITKKPDLDVVNLNGQTPLHPIAWERNKSAWVDVLLYAGAAVDIRDNEGQTALHAAAKFDCGKTVDRLLDAGATVNIVDNEGRTALHFAVQPGSPSIVNALIRAGAIVDTRDNEGQTAMHTAAKMGYNDTVDALLDASASVDIRDNNGRTAMHEAAKMGYVTTVHALLDAGASVDMKDNKGRTAMHEASKMGHITTVRALLGAGASVDMKDNESRTALHQAADIGNFPTMKKLIGFGAKLDEIDRSGRTPMQLAMAPGRFTKSEIYALLEASKLGSRDTVSKGHRR